MNREVAKVFDERDLDRITAAVTAAEAGTSGEIAVAIVAHSRSWRSDGWLLSSLLALLAGLAYLFVLRASNWGTFYPVAQATLAGVAVFGAALLFFSYWFFRPAQTKRDCWRNALKHFAALRPTRAETAVLILISVAEQHAAIVADRGIAGKVPAEYWHGPQGTISDALRKGRAADGLVAAIGDIGARLREHFPRPADDTNELPDRPAVG